MSPLHKKKALTGIDLEAGQGFFHFAPDKSDLVYCYRFPIQFTE